MSENRDLVLSETLANEVDELVEVGDEPIERHRGSRNVAIERLASAALIPMNDGEGAFERRIEASKESHFAHARTAVQHDERRVIHVLPAHHHPLIDAAKPDVLDRRDA